MLKMSFDPSTVILKSEKTPVILRISKDMPIIMAPVYEIEQSSTSSSVNVSSVHRNSSESYFDASILNVVGKIKVRQVAGDEDEPDGIELGDERFFPRYLNEANMVKY